MMNYRHLTKQVLEDLKVVNSRLMNLQEQLIPEAFNLDRELKLRVADENDSLDDYEIELQLIFHLKEDDKSYIEGEENILTSMEEYIIGVSGDIEKYPWRRNDNHNDFRALTEHPISQEHHCWWFHCLYDHNHLKMTDLLRIGIIQSDIIVRYQYIK